MRSVRWLLGLLTLIALASHFYRGETLHFRLLERSGTLGYQRYLFDFHRFPDGTGRYRGELTWQVGGRTRQAVRQGALAPGSARRLVVWLERSGVWTSGCVDRGEKVTRVEVEISHGFRHHQFYVDQMGCSSYNEVVWLAVVYDRREYSQVLPGQVLRECRQQAGLPDPRP